MKLVFTFQWTNRSKAAGSSQAALISPEQQLVPIFTNSTDARTHTHTSVGLQHHRHKDSHRRFSAYFTALLAAKITHGRRPLLTTSFCVCSLTHLHVNLWLLLPPTHPNTGTLTIYKQTVGDTTAVTTQLLPTAACYYSHSENQHPRVFTDGAIIACEEINFLEIYWRRRPAEAERQRHCSPGGNETDVAAAGSSWTWRMFTDPLSRWEETSSSVVKTDRWSF